MQREVTSNGQNDCIIFLLKNLHLGLSVNIDSNSHHMLFVGSSSVSLAYRLVLLAIVFVL